MAETIESAITKAGEKFKKADETIVTPTEQPATNGATTTTDTNEPPKTETKPDVQTGEAETDLQKFLKENNLSSVDELKDKITPKRQKTPDEEEKEMELWGIQNEGMKDEDFLSVKELQKKKDADVVYDDWAAKLLAKNKNLTPQDLQKKWDKQFGEVIPTDELDEEGNQKTKIVYDDDEISERAKVIRELKSQPINSIRLKFTNAQKEQEFTQRAAKEFLELSKTIPDKVKIKIDDKNMLDYDLEAPYKEKLLPKLAEQYFQFKRMNPNEKLDSEKFMNAVSNVVMQDNFGNIANIYAGKRVSEKELEIQKKLENPIVQPIDLNTGKPSSVDMKKEAKNLRDNLPKVS